MCNSLHCGNRAGRPICRCRVFGSRWNPVWCREQEAVARVRRLLQWHRPPAGEREASVGNDLQRLGWRELRFSREDVLRRERHIAALVREGLV